MKIQINTLNLESLRSQTPEIEWAKLQDDMLTREVAILGRLIPKVHSINLKGNSFGKQLKIVS